MRKVLLAEAPYLAQRLAEEVAATVLALMTGYYVLLAPATTIGKNVLPRVAALLDVAQVSDIVEVKSPNIFVRPVYAGNALETVETSDKIIVGTVRTTAFAAAGEGGSAPIETVTAAPSVGLSSFEGSEISESERPELTAARIVVSGGRGMQSGDNFKKLIEPLADRLGAAVGASPRRGRCRLHAERSSGRADGQGGGAGAVHRRRHLRRHPASCRHEGLQGDRRHQQGCRGADLPGRRLSASSATCSPSCRSSTPN